MDRRGFLRAGISAGAAGLVLPFLGGHGQEAARGAWRTAPAHAGADVIRLNSNENALGMAPSARKAIVDCVSGANRYPFAAASDLTAQIAANLKVPESCVTLGCGSAEILQMVTQAFATKDALILMADPTFEAVADFAKPFPARLAKIPLRADFSHDMERMRAEAERHPGPVLVYICNPNNPTGTITDCNEIEKWINAAPQRVTFFIDEAYHQFAKDPRYFSFSGQAAKNHNVIVAHTFSKVYGMAGMRQGYSVSTPDTKARLEEYSTGLGVNLPALCAASASLLDTDYLNESLAANERSRKILVGALDELAIDHLPSEANFVMFKLKGKIQDFNRQMAAENIWVGRPFPPMEDHCRLTLGLESEMNAFVRELRGFREKNLI